MPTDRQSYTMLRVMIHIHNGQLVRINVKKIPIFLLSIKKCSCQIKELSLFIKKNTRRVHLHPSLLKNNHLKQF